MPSAKTNTLTIQTPEGVEFSFLLAGPITRFWAWSIDVACIGVLVSTAGYVGPIIAPLSPDLASATLALLYFAITIGYGVLMEWYWRGQTLGKRLLRLRVMDVQGLRLQFSQILIRNLLRVVDSIPFLYLVGGTTCLFNRYTQRLGDLAANTVVVWLPQTATPDFDRLLGDKYNSFRECPHIEARLRQRSSPEEAALALQAILRRNTLEPQARIELFAMLSEHFRAAATFPEEATLGLTDEQYVRNVVDVLYRPKTTRPDRPKIAPPASKEPVDSLAAGI